MNSKTTKTGKHCLLGVTKNRLYDRTADAHLEGDDYMHAWLLHRTDDHTATRQKRFCILFMWTSTICCKLRHTSMHN